MKDKVKYTQAFVEWLKNSGYKKEQKQQIKNVYDNITIPHTKPAFLEIHEFLFLIGEWHKANAK